MSNIGSVGRNNAATTVDNTPAAETPQVAAAATGGASLAVGSRGEPTRALQTSLRALGYLSGAADGVFGRGTATAVAAFQRANGLTPSGEADAATLAKLQSPTAVRGTLTPAPAGPPRSAFAEGGARALNDKMNAHFSSIDRTGIGTIYGDHSSFKSMSASERQQWIDQNKKAGSTPPAPKQSSCIGWAMENVKAAYVAAGKTQRWNEIERIVVAKGTKGTDLAKELQKDGWEGIYFNPDPKKSDDGNAEHTFTASQVKKGKPYYGVNVTASVTNYRPTEGSGTAEDLATLRKLEQVPFFFGLARGGVHTFVGQKGRVNEMHWDRMPDDKGAIEERSLKDFPWNSGVIMVPPGTWPR